jgi:hypothetical protein
MGVATPRLPSLPDQMWRWLCEEIDVRPEVVAEVRARLATGERPSADALVEILLAWRAVVAADGAVVPAVQLRSRRAAS